MSGWLRRLSAVRKDLLALRTGGTIAVLGVDDGAVFAWHRRHPRSGNFVGLADFSAEPQSVGTAAFGHLGRLETAPAGDGPLVVREGRAGLRVAGGALTNAPYG